MDKDSLIATAKMFAGKYGLDPTLVCAVAEQESDWNPWAIRYEPAFYSHYVLPNLESGHFSATEATMRATSWGLLQLMGEVAREYAFGGPFLSELCNPEVGLDMGCKYLSALYGKVNNDMAAALQRWNGGGNPSYSVQVIARMKSYM